MQRTHCDYCGVDMTEALSPRGPFRGQRYYAFDVPRSQCDVPLAAILRMHFALREGGADLDLCTACFRRLLRQAVSEFERSVVLEDAPISDPDKRVVSEPEGR